MQYYRNFRPDEKHSVDTHLDKNYQNYIKFTQKYAARTRPKYLSRDAAKPAFNFTDAHKFHKKS